MDQEEVKQQLLKAESIALSVKSMLNDVNTEDDMEKVKNKISEFKEVKRALG